MSSKDMFRKEQRFSFRKFSFGLASAVIANVIFGGAIASSPIVHANTAEPTSTVVTSERLASVSYTVNVVDQAGTVINTQTKNVSVQTTEATAVATANLTTDLVPEGYALVSGLGQVTVTENAENVFTVVVEKATSEVASTEDSAAVSASETSTTAATSEETSTATSETVSSTASAASETSTKATSEVANTAAVAVAAAETVPNKTERTAYLSYITHYVNEANETVDRTGHLVAVTTTDDTAKTQVTVSASENMPSGWELVQDKAKVVVQLVENQTNILVFAVTKKSKEEEIAASQLSNKDVLEQVLSEGVLLSNDAARLLETSQAGNTGLEVATNNTKAVLKEAIQVFDEPTSTQAQVDAQTELVRAASKTLADELLKFDEDGVLTAMLDATTQAITITTSEKGRVRPNYPIHIRDFANSNQGYNGRDFFFGLIDQALTQENSQIRATAEAADGSNPSISLLEGRGGQPLSPDKSFGLQINNSGVIYGTTTIKEAGDTVSWQFQAQNGSETARKQFTFVPYTVVKTDNEPVRKAVTAGVTADEILAKVKSDVTRGDGSTQGPLNATFEEYFNTTLTARAMGKSTTVTEDAKNGKQIWHEIKQYVKVAEANGTAVSGGEAVTGSLPTEAGTYDVTVLSTNVHGQTIENVVKVILNAAPSMPTIGVNPNVKPNNNDSRKLEVLHVFGNVTGTTEAVSTSGSAAAPDFDTTKATKSFPVTDPEKDTVTLKYGVPGYVTTYEAGNPDSFTANGRELISAETKNIGVPNTEQLLFDAEGKLTGELTLNPGQFYSRIVKMTDTAGNVSYSNPFYVIAYTDKRADNTDLTVAAASDLTEANIFGKLTIDTVDGSVNPALTVPTSEYTRKIVGYRLPGEKDPKALSTDTLNTLPAGQNYEIKVETTNPYGQTIYNWVPVNDTRTVGIDKTDIYVFKGSPIQTVAAGTYTEDNVDKVQVVTVEDKDGVDAISYYQSPSNRVSPITGITITPEAGTAANQSVGYATGTPTAGVGVYSRSFGVTDANNKLEFVNTNVNGVDNRQATHVMDATADGTLQKQAGETVTKDEILAKVKVDTGDSNTVVADPTTMYKMDLAPGETVPTAPGEYDVKVRVVTLSNVYKDVTVKVIIDKYADTLTATAAENTSLVPGSGTAAKQPIVINDANGATTAPAGTTYEIDPAFKAEKEALGYEISVSPTGEVSVKAPAGQEADITVPVTVTYPDKTTDSVSVPFKVNQKDTAQLKAKEAIDKKLADETKALEDKKNAEIAAITNNPDLTPDQKDAAVKDITDAAEIAKKALNDAAGVAKDNVDAATTPEEAKAAQTAGETTLADLENGAEAALDLITAKAEAKDAIADKLADEVKELEAKQAEAEKAIDASTMTPEEKEAAKKALQDVVDAEKAKLEDAAKKATDAVDAATTPADVKAAEIAGETALTEAGKNAEKAVELAKDKELAKEAIRTEAEEATKAAEKLADDAIKAINDNPNLSDTEKQAAIDKVNDAAKVALDTIADNAKAATEAAENAQALADLEAAKKAQKDADKGAIDTATPLVDAAVLEAAKQDALNKLEDDTAKAKETIAANPNLSKKEVDKALADLEKDLAKAKDAVNAATTPEKVQTAEDKGVDVIAGDVLAAAQLDALNKLEEDTKETIAAIEANPNLTEDEKKAAIAKAEDLADDAKSDIMTAETPEAVQAVEEKADKDLAKEELKAATDDAKKAIDANPNLTPDEKKVAKDALDAEVAKATDAIDKAATPADVNTATLAGEKVAAKAEVAAAADDAKKAIASNPNLDDTAKAAAIKAVEEAAKQATEAIDAAKTPADVNAATLAGEKAAAKEELKAAAADAIAAINANPNLDEKAKAEAVKAVEDAAKTATDAIDAAKTPADVNATTLAGEQAVAKAEV
ncbi:TPA: DUF1542 domain-containing protein, partial [Streptococcus suis]|nr:DUF1542 domain-containing protein [Streptococcus suis]